MNIIYVSRTSSKKKFFKLFKVYKQMPGQQAQKYHRLIMEGIVKNGAKVKTVTALPITKANYKGKLIKEDYDEENNVEYNYLPIYNIYIMKNIFIIINSYFKTLEYLKENEDAIVICDVLNMSVSTGALLAAKVLKRNNIGIVTDIPIFLANSSISFFVILNNFLINQFDSYVFLTEQMNDLINIHKKPHVVIEGQVDINMDDINNELANKDSKKVCMYAGGLQKIYGIELLVNAFLKANIQEAELHLYGSGDFEDQLIEICKKNQSIKYFGVVPNDEIVIAELEATLLVNPRPSNEEFTKYSFPSKNMEYMVSGTPILTTKLQGMPEEYYPYVYLIENESIEGLTNSLKTLLSKDRQELHEKGQKAKKFVLEKKNNIIQAKKIMNLFDS